MHDGFLPSKKILQTYSPLLLILITSLVSFFMNKHVNDYTTGCDIFQPQKAGSVNEFKDLKVYEL